MQLRVSVLGAGSFGTTIAHLATHNAPTVLWCRRPETAEEINRERTNSTYLPGQQLSPKLRATPSLEEAVGQADVVVMGVPSLGLRGVLDQARQHIRPWVPVLSLD